MRLAIVALLVGLTSSGAQAARPSRVAHVFPLRVASHAASGVSVQSARVDHAALAMRPMPTIKTYYPQAYGHIAAAVDTASRAHRSDGEIAGTVGTMSNALMGEMAPFYDTNNTIEYMALSRDLLRAVVAEMPDACVDLMRSDGRLSGAARETLAALIAKQPAWRPAMMEAALKQAATVPATPVAGAPNAIVVQSIREVAYQNVPAALRPYLHVIEASKTASPRESEAACRFASGVISATMELPPEQAAATFKLLSRADHGVWTLSESLIPTSDTTMRLTVASREP